MAHFVANRCHTLISPMEMVRKEDFAGSTEDHFWLARIPGTEMTPTFPNTSSKRSRHFRGRAAVTRQAPLSM
jgi:hypothetical protein